MQRSARSPGAIRGIAPFHRAQLASVTAAGAADLPDISRREPAAQRVESAIATRAALLISLSATGRWVLTISRTFAMKKVHSEHVHSAAPVNAARAPGEPGLFVVMATNSHGSPGHPAGASLGEGATRRAGVLREHPPLFLGIRPQEQERR